MSNKYLLLRNNKQNGPFTLDEIREMNLKAYDLVWVEGKSAAWRYPGEIEELKPFAPPVEEQPFDRFFKKPAAQQDAAITDTSKPASSGIPLAKVPEPGQQLREESKNREETRNITEKPAAGRTAVPPVYVNMPASSKPVTERTQNPFSKDKKPKERESQDTVIPIEKKPVVKAKLPTPPNPAHSSEHNEEVAYLKQQNGLSPAIPVFPERAAANYHEKRKTNSSARSFLLGFGLVALVGLGIAIGIWISHRGNISSVGSSIAQTSEPSKQQSGNLAVVNSNEKAQQDKHSLIVNNPSPEILNNSGLMITQKKKSRTSRQKNPDTIQAQSPTPVSPIDSSAVTAQREVKHRPDVADGHNEIKENIVDYVQLSHNKYTVGTFGGIDDLQVTVSNESPFSLDLVVVEVQYVQSNKKIFKRENLYYRDIRAGAAIMQPAPKSQRGIKIQYKITVINSKDSGISYSDI